MTVVGAGGVTIATTEESRRFGRDYKKLTPEMKDRVDSKLRDLLADPRPSGLSFEKLKGWSSPDIYSVHVTGNYKITFSVEGSHAFLRRVADHDEIDRQP